MANDEVSWVDTLGLQRAADGLEAAAGRYRAILAKLPSLSTLVDPNTFGDDHGAREFLAKWKKDVEDWYESAYRVADGITGASQGVLSMVRAYKAAAENAENLAEQFYNSTKGGPQPLNGNSGVETNLQHVPSPAPLPPTSGNNSGGGYDGRR
ncbi:hypothetical protein C8D88_10822 [Lentzea atacamensis]|uniref:Excreted virulence factor EspC, type VII ESX diderm n=2 Tax=Lentzea TaxID=165301 RepID=A0A316HVG2_9PSEU|nr:hypothetical protein [Lentzea atacamensis]PWK84407.1 hypothetical protein C8D88_10822 [Lentzea atacamensis]